MLALTKSSLEEMLESLIKGDEAEKPRDLPPALPARPKPNPRARPPSPKRPSVATDEAEPTHSCNNVRKIEDSEVRWDSLFGIKRVRVLQGRWDSPYDVAARDDDVVKYFIEKKFRVWGRLRDGTWELGQIKSASGEKVSILMDDRKAVTLPKKDILPANPIILEGVDDLIQLAYLNEPSILHNLQRRYSQDLIYSKAGPVLVVVNPYKEVQLFEDELVAAYKERLLDSPHVYAIVDAAYNRMMTDESNQSIIISGVSGAGKTETANIAMQYLAALGGEELKIRQANYILEAFGNAKTSLNNNSSRFGKIINIHFSSSGKICSAQIQTFLLEKSRVVQLAQGERSFHIFYQLCYGASHDLRGRLRLKAPSDYNYLNHDCLKINGVDDIQKFHLLMESFDSVKVSKEDQEHAFEMVAAVLWLGNVSFVVADTGNHVEVVADEAITNSAALIGSKKEDLMFVLSTRMVQAGKDKVARRLTLQQAMMKRDALAKFIYASLFEWLVKEINSLLATGKNITGPSISIVDIYGFESFTKNRFEQLCINYANERLHQHFNHCFFKLEQEEYELDGIGEARVEFEDNQECLDLFEKKSGLISLLDEESNLSKSTDTSLATKIKQHLNSSRCFKVEKAGTFSIHHYAGEVLYDIMGFLEKNRDHVHSDIIELLQSCKVRLAQYLTSLACQNHSVAMKFKGEIFKLTQHLQNTTTHFICCVKPNRRQIPGAFEKDIVLAQLRCSKVLEVVRDLRYGYPTRLTHEEFLRRYKSLLPESIQFQDPLSVSVAILQQFGLRPEMYQVGYTKFYFRAGQIDVLEDVRNQVMKGNLEAKRWSHGHHSSLHFHELKGVVVTLQSYIRGEIARKKYNLLLKKQVPHENMLVAAVQIQSVFRGWLARRHYNHLVNAKQSNASKLKSGRRMSEVKDLLQETSPSVVEELQKRLTMAEAALGKKEKETSTLRDQLSQSEARWSEYEAKMKSMEEMWQKQTATLKMSLASAKRNVGTDNLSTQSGRINGAQSPYFYDSEDTSMGTHTPGNSTPVRFPNNGTESSTTTYQDTNGGLDPVNTLVKEFEQRRRNFDEDFLSIVEAKSEHSPTNPVQEYRRLKHRFEAWKKEYRVRLREAKSKVNKMAQGDTDKHRRKKWWGKTIIF